MTENLSIEIEVLISGIIDIWSKSVQRNLDAFSVVFPVGNFSE